MAFTEFKTASQAIHSNDQELELTTEKNSEGSEEGSGDHLEGPTSVLKSQEESFKSSSAEEGFNSSETTTTTADVKEASSVIESSSNDLASQLSTSKQQQQQKQQLNKESVVKALSQSEEDCNSELNPNCMPATTLANDIQVDQQTTQSVPEISSSSLEVVTSSLLEPNDGFCSESDADCSLKPTAAMLTQDNLKTAIPTTTTTTADHFLAFEASRQSEDVSSTVRPNKNSTGSENGNENVIATEETRKKSDRRADGLPDVNDIINGLLNVVGEGLTIATNYVKEEHKRKKDALASQVKSNGKLFWQTFVCTLV